MITGAQAWLVWVARGWAMEPKEGAYTMLFAATAPEVREQREKYAGKYIVPFGKVQRPKKGARGDEKARILWESTEKIMDDLLGTVSKPVGVAEAENGNLNIGSDVEKGVDKA